MLLVVLLADAVLGVLICGLLLLAQPLVELPHVVLLCALLVALLLALLAMCALLLALLLDVLALLAQALDVLAQHASTAVSCPLLYSSPFRTYMCESTTLSSAHCLRSLALPTPSLCRLARKHPPSVQLCLHPTILFFCHPKQRDHLVPRPLVVPVLVNQALRAVRVPVRPPGARPPPLSQLVY